MNNKFSEGSPVDVTVPAGGCTSGKGLLIGTALFGIAMTTGAQNDTVALALTGVFDVDSDTGAAWAAGDAIYWDNTAKKFTKTTTSNTRVGVAVAAKTSSATTGRVRIQPMA